MTEDENRYLATHDAHDFKALRRRWSALAKEGLLEEQTLSDVEGGQEGPYPVLAYRTRPLTQSEKVPAIYMCAGVHGDEPAGVWGLLEWAESRIDWLREHRAFILPCFNPWGLINNRRSDAEGRDLNRLFHRADVPVMGAWREVVGDSRFELALMLHEDYDARGTYVYELTAPERHLAEAGLKACEAIMPREPRSVVEGNDFENGIFRRSEGMEMEQVVEEELDGGYPEAIYLFMHHARASLTFETPSEYSLWDRVRAQRCFIDAVVDEAL